MSLPPLPTQLKFPTVIWHLMFSACKSSSLLRSPYPPSSSSVPIHPPPFTILTSPLSPNSHPHTPTHLSPSHPHTHTHFSPSHPHTHTYLLHVSLPSLPSPITAISIPDNILTPVYQQPLSYMYNSRFINFVEWQLSHSAWECFASLRMHFSCHSPILPLNGVIAWACG